MLRTRWHYWTCGKFAERILGEKKPYALEWGAWDDYYADLKKRKPIRYWISQKLLKYLQDIIYYPYDIYHSVDCYIRNRWIDKTHMIDTGFKPGHFYEIDEKILHGLFTELVDFVEKDLAHMGAYSDRSIKYTFKNGRCVEAAYEYFKWANRLKDTDDTGKKTTSIQAIVSRKIKKLYEWWKNKRPNRPDPYEISGWNDHCTITEDIFKSNKTEQTIKQTKRMLEKISRLEEKYDNEDTNMLIELIKIRHHLWS
jgi:hypothetical protein